MSVIVLHRFQDDNSQVVIFFYPALPLTGLSAEVSRSLLLLKPSFIRTFKNNFEYVRKQFYIETFKNIVNSFDKILKLTKLSLLPKLLCSLSLPLAANQPSLSFILDIVRYCGYCQISNKEKYRQIHQIMIIKVRFDNMTFKR